MSDFDEFAIGADFHGQFIYYSDFTLHKILSTWRTKKIHRTCTAVSQNFQSISESFETYVSESWVLWKFGKIFFLFRIWSLYLILNTMSSQEKGALFKKKLVSKGGSKVWRRICPKCGVDYNRNLTTIVPHFKSCDTKRGIKHKITCNENDT